MNAMASVGPWSVAFSVLLMSVVHAGAQGTPDPRGFETWRLAVEAHTAAQRDAPVVELARWSYRELNALLPAVSRLDPDERARLVRKALLLHTDVAIAHRRPAGYDLPPHGPPPMVFADGLSRGGGTATYHWDFARALITRLPAGTPRADIARTFYRATGALMQWWSAHTELEAHLDAARRTLGDDPVLLLQEGTLHQVFAHPRAQAAFEEAARQGGRRRSLTSSRGAMVPVQRSIASERVQAERAFRHALRLEPTLHEARIRLTHVLLDRGRDDEALDELEHVPIESLSPMLSFYLHLVQGRAERALDRLDAARRSFESAQAIVPNAQTPRLALSEVSLALGDHVAAREHLAALSEDSARIEDLWPVLGRTHDGADEMMREMWTGF